MSYNTLGQLITKQDPSTIITLENGGTQTLRPTTRYYYDVAGRLVGTEDANNNRSTQSLLPGSGLGRIKGELKGPLKGPCWSSFFDDEPPTFYRN